MNWLGLRLVPPAGSYDGFKFRMAQVICAVFGVFGILFVVKHAVVMHGFYDVELLPEPFRIIWNYVEVYYLETAWGALELLLILAGFAATFWLNLPKHYFAGRYRDYGKERASAEAKSITLLLTLTGLCLVLFSVPFLTLHFPVWVSFLVKYGPIAGGVLRYLSILPDGSSVERMPEISQMDWDARCFNATYLCAQCPGLTAEINNCSAELSASDPEARAQFLRQGTANVTWSGVDTFFNNLEACLGVRGESISLYSNGSSAIEFAISEIMDARCTKPTVVLTTDAEHKSVREVLERLHSSYRFSLHSAPIQSLLWTNAPSQEIVASLLRECVEHKPDVMVVSHVFSHSGVPVDLKALIEGAREAGLSTLFIVDGSHAVGNIAVSDGILLRSAYYAFNGHNWLLGTPYIGVLIRNEWLLRLTGDIPEASALPRPFSIAKAPGANEKGISREEFLPWFALNYVLRHEWLPVGLEAAGQHTRRLAALFRREIQRRDIRVIPNLAESSMVVITDVPKLQAVHRALERNHVRCRMVGADVEGKRAFGIRFCFHHYHDDEDVRDLAEFIGKMATEDDEPGAQQDAGTPHDQGKSKTPGPRLLMKSA